jgi:hypothetical protein
VTIFSTPGLVLASEAGREIIARKASAEINAAGMDALSGRFYVKRQKKS